MIQINVLYPVAGRIHLSSIRTIDTRTNHVTEMMSKKSLNPLILLPFMAILYGGFIRPGYAATDIMEEIVVTATRSEKTVRENPWSVSLVSADQIRMSSMDQLADLVVDLPGIFVSDAGQAGQKRIRIRGEESRRMALLIDGQEFLDHREVGVPLLVDTSQIARIEVVRGPASVLYGPKAMGGVINVITQKPTIDPFRAQLSLALNSATGGQLFSTQLRGRVRKAWNWNVGGFVNDQGLRDTPQGRIENTAYNSQGFNGSIGYTGQDFTTGIGYEKFLSDSDVYVEPEVRFTPPFRDFAIEIPKRDREKFNAFYHWTPLGHYLQSLKIDAYRQVSDREFNTFPSLTLAPGLDSDISIFTTSDLTTDGINIQSDWQFTERLSVIAGLQWTRDEVDQMRDRQVSINGASPRGSVQTDRADLSTTALYFQGEAEVSDQDTLTAGFRLYRVDGSLNRSSHFETLPDFNDRHAISSLAWVHTLNADSTVRLSWSEGYIYPSLLNLVMGAFAGSRFINPVTDLKPEKSDTFELGYRYGNGIVSVDSVLFYTRATNYIDHVFCSAEDACPGRRDKIYRNVGEARSHGVELSFSMQPGAWKYDASVTWLERRKVYEGVDTWKSGIPRYSGFLAVSRTMEIRGNPLSSRFVGRFESGTEELSVTSRGREIIDPSPGYGVFDLELGYQLDNGASIQLVAANLANRKYHSATENLDAAGRHIRLKFSYAFQP